MYFHKAQEKPRLYGSFQDRQYSIWRNLEDIYRCDHESEVLIIPGFWGLPPLDYSKFGNNDANHGATYKDGSLSFDGDNDYVDVIDSASLNPLAITVSARIKANSFSNSYNAIQHKGDDQSYYVIFIKSTGKLGLFIFCATQAVLYDGSGEYTLSPNVEYSISMTYNSTDGLKGYVNGNLDDTVSPAGTIRSTSGLDFFIGKDNYTADREFDGFIDEVRVSNVARTADQIALFHENPYGLYRRVAKPIWSIPAAGGIGVSATIDSLSLIENAANINAEVNISAGADVLVITEAVATIKVDSDIQADIDALVITENVAIIKVDNNVQAGADALVLTENPVMVNAEISISAGVDVLTLTENAADVNLDVNVSAEVDALTIAESAANINAEVSISAEIDILALTENAATVNAETDINASIDTLTLSLFTADIKVDIDIQATLETLIIAEYSASVETGAGSTKFISEQLGLNQIQGLF